MVNSKKVKIQIPASSANLGPGFDVAACALNLFLELDLEWWPEEEFCPNSDKKYIVLYSGDRPQLVPLDHTNLVLQSALHLIYRMSGGKQVSEDNLPQHDSSLFPHPFCLKITNPIPLSRGLGSSAAAIVGGMMMSNQMCNFNLTKDELLDYILEMEGHPDNVGASLFGGFIVGFIRTEEEMKNKKRKCGYQIIKWNTNIKIICIVPEFELSTKIARAVLPLEYTREDAVHNLQRLAVFVAFLSTQQTTDEIDADFFKDLITDRFHQTYRYPLIPGLKKLIENFSVPGLLGVVLSGAGPSILCFATNNLETIGKEAQKVFISEKSEQYPDGIPSQVMHLEVTEGGAKIIEMKDKK